MTPTWMKLTRGAVVVVALSSIAVGLASPDGSVGDAAASTSPAPSRTTAPTPPAPTATASRPVDRCAAVTTSGADEAERVFGRAAVDAAACAAVAFVMDHRYSRLSLPRRTYEAADFDAVLPSLDPATVERVYRPRIASFIARHGSDTAGEQLGLVLFTAAGTSRDAAHASAGNGHVFYGPAFTTAGYRHRDVWINQRWSPVTIRVDRSAGEPRIAAELTASAAVPVWDTTSNRDAMLTVPTRATFLLRPHGDTSWRIAGWTIHRGTLAYAPLSVR